MILQAMSLKSAEILVIYFVRLQNVCWWLVVEIINPAYYNNILRLEIRERGAILGNILCLQRLCNIGISVSLY